MKYVMWQLNVESGLRTRTTQENSDELTIARACNILNTNAHPYKVVYYYVMEK